MHACYRLYGRSEQRHERHVANQPAGAAVVYGLYKDAGRSQPWGDGATPGSTVAGTGTGAAKGYTVYGRVPPQTTPTPGTYSDTVVVTVTY